MKSRRDLIWFAIIAAVVAILLYDSLFTGKGLVPADGVLNYPPWNQSERPANALLADQFLVFLPTLEFVHQQKTFPLWNPNIFCGAPNLGAIQSGLFFPIRLLFAWLDPFAASGPTAFLKLCLTGWFTLLFVRLLGVSDVGALLSAIAFSLCGFMILWLGHPLVSSAMWLPLLLYFVEKSFLAETSLALVAPWLGFSIALACTILGGHPPTAIHVSLVVGAYFLFRLSIVSRKQLLVRAGLLAGALVLAFLLAAPQVLPYLEYYHHSSSAAASASLARWSSKHEFRTLIQFLFPNLFGNPAKGFDDLRVLLDWSKRDVFNAITGYVGILPLFFAGWGIAYRRSPYTIFFVSVTLVSLLITYGIPPFPVLMRALPLLRDITHTRLLLMVAFSIAVLAGFGWDEFTRIKSRKRSLFFAGGFGLTVAIAVFYFWYVAGARFHALDLEHRTFVWRQFLVVAIGLAAIAIAILWPANWKRWVPAALCTTWAAADLLYFGHGFNPAISRDRYYPRTEAIAWLQKDASVFRIFGGGDVLPPDSAEVFGLSDVRGSDFMSVRRYERLITGQEGDFSFYSTAERNPDVFPLLNAKYVLSAEPVALNPDDFELVYSKEIAIYRFKHCVDRALLLYDYEVEPDPAKARERLTARNFDPAQTLLLEEQPQNAAGSPRAQSGAMVRISSYEPDDVTIDATLERAGFLLLLDTYFPGWQATINGRQTKIYRADYNFRAVQLPAGQSRVHFAYRPVSLRIGVCLWDAGILILAGVGVVCIRRARGATDRTA